MAMNVQNKTALITGAGSGINFTFAKVLLEKGCNVVIADLTLRPESEELVRAYSGEGKSVKAVFVKTDVADWGQLERAFDVAVEEFGGVDIVVPGAGIYEPVSNLMDDLVKVFWSNFCSRGRISGIRLDRKSQKMT
jgi:3-hydroxybutyrate dehydrogenase